MLQLRRSLAVSAAVLLPSVVAAQSGTGIVTGHVTGSAHRSLASAAVWIDSSAVLSTTGDDGSFRLLRVPAGHHTLYARFIGYAVARRTIEVVADSTVTADVALSEIARELSAIRIEGQRDAQSRALGRQQNADNVSNVVSADVIGRTPDINTAEALQRLPGVSVQRDQGEGRFFQVRGTPPEYSAVSMNGLRVPAPDRSTRAVALDAIMPDALSTIVLSKTLTPDMDADAIGGSVNLITKSAEIGKTTENVTFARGYDPLAKGGIGNYAATLGRRFNDEKLGVLFGGSYQTTDRGSNDYEADWNSVTLANKAVTTTATNYEPRDYLLNRTRQSYFGTVDYRVDERTSLALRASVNDFSDDEDRRRTRFRPGTYQPGDSATASRLERTLRVRQLADQIQSYTLNGEHVGSFYKLDGLAGWAQARETNPERTEVTFRQSNVTFNYNDVDPYNPVLHVTKGNLDQANLYAFNALTQNYRDAKDRDLTGKLNLTLPFRTSALAGDVKFGASYRGKTKDSQEADIVTTKFPVPFTLDSVMGSYTNTGYRFGSNYFATSNIDRGNLEAFINRYAATRTIDTAAAHLTRDPNLFTAHENVSAGYAMMTVDERDLRIIPGVRVEHTAIDSKGFIVNTKNGVWTSSTPSSTSGSYTDVLPMLNARYRVDDATNVRAAIARSLSRPIYDNIRSYALPDVQSQTVTLGNPSLHASHATNFDLMAEHFFAGIGVVSAGYFQKNITDFVAPVQFTETTGSYAGYIATQPQQGGSATIRGVEMNWQQQFTFLPRYFAGLGLNSNYTVTSSSAQVPNQNRSADFVALVPRMGNVGVFYEYGPLQTRLAWNMKASFLDAYGTDASTDTFTKGTTQLDWTANVDVGRGARWFLEAINLTNQPLTRYKGNPNQPIQQEYYRSWFTTGIRWAL